MFGRPKYTYYSYSEKDGYRGSKKKYKVKKNRGSEYDEIKEDACKLCSDVKKIFNKNSNKGWKVPKAKKCKSKNNKGTKFICLGIIGFIIMSAVITFPAALLVCLIGFLLYSFE